MKKVLLLLVIMMAIGASAQTWERVEVPGDELKGTPNRVKWRINNFETLQSIMFYEGDDQWWVGIGGNIFQPNGQIVKSTQNFATSAIIGLSDEAGNLIAKYEDCLLELTNGMQVAGTVENFFGKTTKGARDVVPYLTNNKGSVRIIIPTARGKEFDLRVPCMNNE